MTGRRRAGAAAALGVALLLTASASPASAAPVITVTGPTEGAALDSSTVPISGRVEVAGLATIKEVFLTLGDTRHDVRCAGSPCTFTWSPSLPRNGRYEVTVSATEQTLILEGAKSTLTRKFAIDAPPAKPALDVPKVTEGRTVELSWARNTEPDMLFYAVFRKDPGGTTFGPVGTIKQPESGAAVAYTDATTTATGGEFSYQVVAVRKGGTKPEIASTPSTARTAGVPLPPTTTTAAPAPGTPAAGATTTTVKAGSAAGADLSGFLAARSQAAPAPPPTILEPPDTGFEGELPFGAALPGQELEEGDAEAVLPNTERSTSAISLDAGRPLVPVAAGLVLLLLALHLRVLNRRLKPAGDGDLPIEAPAPRRPAPAALEQEQEWQPEPEPEGAQTAFYDIADQAGWDADWAPQPEDDAQPEPAYVAELSPEEPNDRAEPDEPEYDMEPQAPAPDADLDPDAIEVFDVIAPERRALARSGSR